MFIAVPLENKPTWRSPPWMTVLLIFINCVIFWGWQVPEEKAMRRAAQAYAQTPLPAIELPLFVQHLRQESERKGSRVSEQMVKMTAALLKAREYAQLYEFMWQERNFRQQLLDGQVITPEHAAHAEWSEARTLFAPREPQPFTTRWAMSYEPGAGWQPLQAFTSTFLHGDTGHLVGNMVFLFLFGFTLEMALGALVYVSFYALCGFSASLVAAYFYEGMGGFGLGASGAVSGLMAMYAVLYRMRRIRFFYMIAFYFNYATWPALVLLPVWLGFELAQHLLGGRGVAYMAHFGGLLTGALLMAAYMRITAVRTPVDPRNEEDKAAKARKEALDAAIQRARKRTHTLDFPSATRAWREAAKLAPTDIRVLRAWFESARHQPASEDFHIAARAIFKLPASSDSELQVQHHCWRSYWERAQPVPRISDNTLHTLARNFVKQGQFADAQKLCRLLEKSTAHPHWNGTLTLLVNGMAQAGRMEEARTWLPTLERDAPQDPITRWLARRHT